MHSRKMCLLTSVGLFFMCVSACSDSDFIGNGQKSPSSSDPSEKSDFTSPYPKQSKQRENIFGDDSLNPPRTENLDGGTGQKRLPQDICDKPAGQSRTNVVLGGEDYPNNPVDPGGADYDDFGVTLSGRFLVETGNPLKLGLPQKGTVRFNYVRSLSESNCFHAFKIIVRKCPNKDSTPINTLEVPIGILPLKSVELDVPEDQAFLDIILTTTANPLSSYCKGFAPKDFSILDSEVSPLNVVLNGGGILDKLLLTSTHGWEKE